jgi:hypothetical protein
MTPRFVLAACVLAAGCAAGDAPAPRGEEFAPANASAEQPECFNARFVNGFSEVDRDTVRVRVGQDDYYNVDVTGTCMDLDWQTRLALVTRSSANLCVGPALGDAEIVTPDMSCSVIDIAHSPRRPAADDAAMTPFEPEPN